MKAARIAVFSAFVYGSLAAMQLPGVAQASSRGPLSLTSVVIAGDVRFALIQNEGVIVKRREGETIGAWTVDAIEPSKVTLSRSGATLELTIFGHTPKGMAKVALGAPLEAPQSVVNPTLRPRQPTDWEAAISDLLAVEGSAFNPDDPSRWGIKLSTLQAHRLRLGRREPGLANLKRLTEREARRIYREDFIESFNLDAISDSGLARQVFDATVQHGPGIGLQHLRDELALLLSTPITETGRVGPQTVRAIEALISLGRLNELRQRLVIKRKVFLHRLGRRRPDIQRQLAALMRRAEAFRP